MSRKGTGTWEVSCPCCGATLTIDAKLGKVLHHTPPPKAEHTPDLEHAAMLLEKEKARREALFRQSTEEQKIKSDLLDRKFQEALKQTKDEPVTKPLRDIDLD
jgi:predicted amidophosphoribosyltransferase